MSCEIWPWNQEFSLFVSISGLLLSYKSNLLEPRPGQQGTCLTAGLLPHHLQLWSDLLFPSVLVITSLSSWPWQHLSSFVFKCQRNQLKPSKTEEDFIVPTLQGQRALTAKLRYCWLLLKGNHWCQGLTQGTQYLQGTGLNLLLVPHPLDEASVCTLKGVLIVSWLGEVGTELTV